MENFSTDVLLIGSISSAIIAIWTLIVKVIKPFQDLSDRVSNLERTVDDNAMKLSKDRESFKNQEVVNHMTLEGINNVLKHELTGNHTKEMEECSRKIEDYIYKKGGSL